MPGIHQQRARTAYVAAKAEDTALSETFVSLARQLPLMLRINGLLATWAHLCAKDEPQHRQMLSIMQRHLLQHELLNEGQAKTDARALYREWVGEQPGTPLTSGALRELTDETLHFSGWLKRAVDACAAGESQ